METGRSEIALPGDFAGPPIKALGGLDTETVPAGHDEINQKRVMIERIAVVV